MAQLTFAGFPPAAFDWFEAIAENNKKDWFEANRDTFEHAVRGPFSALMEDAAQVHGGVVRLSRPNRDVRFSKDKSPYKRNLFAVVHSHTEHSATQMTAGGLYASVSADGLFAGTGYHDMSADQLARFRAALHDDAAADALSAAISSAGQSCKVRGRSLKTAPKGYARDHRNIALLRMKEIVAGHQFSRKDCLKPALREEVFQTWRAAAPITDWLNAHVGASTLAR